MTAGGKVYSNEHPIVGSLCQHNGFYIPGTRQDRQPLTSFCLSSWVFNRVAFSVFSAKQTTHTQQHCTTTHTQQHSTTTHTQQRSTTTQHNNTHSTTLHNKNAHSVHTATIQCVQTLSDNLNQHFC